MTLPALLIALAAGLALGAWFLRARRARSDRSDRTTPPRRPVFRVGRIDDPGLDDDTLLELIEIAGREKDRDQVDAVASRLDHPSSLIQVAAAHALGEIGDVRALARLLETSDRLERELSLLRSGTATGAPSPAGEDLAPPTDPVREGEGEGEELEAGSFEDLIWPDATGLGPLVHRLPPRPPAPGELAGALADLALDESETSRTRYFALKNLELTGEATPFERLAPLLAHPSSLLRYATVSVLASAARATPALVGLLESASMDISRPVRLQALFGLARKAPDRARRDLLALAGDPDPTIRAMARAHLEAMGGPMARDR